ncbi:CD27 antigen isoform X2 [Dromiciops gliroides]|uniref:CD27 antigen isoform X2 n=1 Tax=Dromiciops gliroides TaxID=33562 RepID=UPI001CC45126|nr:CD27 antigen isoform X2 [Dromiciops gliroides]
MAPGTSWWLWVLGTLVGLSSGVISKHHCPQGQYQVEQGSWCCRLCKPGTFLVRDCDDNGKDPHCKACIPGSSFTPDHHAQRQCESCRICNNGFLIQRCNITTNTECACPKGQRCRDKECTNCDPQPTYLLSTAQYPVRSTHQHPATIHQHSTNTYSVYYSEMPGTSAPTRPAHSPSGTASSNPVSIYILLLLCGLILAILVHGTWLMLKQRNCQLKKELDRKEPVKLCLTGSRADLGPCCPKQEEGSTVPIQEDYRKPDPASYP